MLIRQYTSGKRFTDPRRSYRGWLKAGAVRSIGGTGRRAGRVTPINQAET